MMEAITLFIANNLLITYAVVFAAGFAPAIGYHINSRIKEARS